MATGISKNKWQEETEIISEESVCENFKYQISYDGKTPKEVILESKPKYEYVSILGNNKENKLFFGDNLDVLKNQIHNSELKGKIKLIYIDPPYGTNSVFHSRNQKSSYKDELIGSQYIEFLRKRLILLRELLSDDGSIYIHLDNNMVFEMKIIMDEIFGADNFRGVISRKKCSNKNYTKKTYGNISDYIIYYSKTENCIWHRATLPWTEEKIKKEYPCLDEVSGRRYKKVPIHAPGIRNGETGKEWKDLNPPKGKHWQYTPQRLDEFDEKGEIYWSANGNPRRKVFFDENKGIAVQDIWIDVQDSVNQNVKTTGYPTEKNPALIERIIKASSDEGDYVLDCFAGSGTTLEVAENLGRKWIGIDNSSEAIEHIFKRFFSELKQMGDFVDNKISAKVELKQKTLISFNSNQSRINSFDFLSDSRFIEIATNITNEYMQVRKKTTSAF